MSLINYVEPVQVGSMFVGLGTMACSLMIAYILYRFYIKVIQLVDIAINRAAKYELLEEVFLDRIADKKGIDLNKELAKRKMLRETKDKNFRQRLEEQIYEDMFGKDNKKQQKGD